MDEDSIGKLIVPAAMQIHTALGAGLLESAYEACLAYELAKRGLMVERQVSINSAVINLAFCSISMWPT